MNTEFEDQFYEDNIDFIRDSKKADEENYSGYLEKMSPYHVRHILVKVSANDKALYDGEITESEAKKLASVGENLALGDETFGSLAQLYSDDTGSAEKFGDLGIMSKSTSFINEFKLGVYAYEAIHNDETKADAKSGLKVSNEMETSYNDVIPTSGIGTIPYEAFLKLEQYSDVTKDENSFLVNKGNAFFYPRNIIFNKYFNRHDISVITPNSVVLGTINGSDIDDENFAGAFNATYNNMQGFKHVPGLNLDVNGDSVVDVNDKVLTTKNGKVILAVRGGTSGDSGYQGFHFIVVERSAFDNESNGVSLSEYYTTKYPGQSGYPMNGDSPKPTYVNFLDQQIKDYKSRAESVEGEIKSFDSNLKYYIYEKLASEQKIQFNDELKYINTDGEEVTIDLGATIGDWIKATRDQADYQTQDAWEDTWEEYVEFLQQQYASRGSKKLLSETCAIQYQNSVKTSALWHVQGGACYYDSK